MTQPWHKRYHSDALSGMIGLTLEQRGAYQTILDMIYDRGGPVIDNDRLLAGYMGCSIRKWRALRQELIEAGKLVEIDGHLSNLRAEKQLENDAKTARKHAENGLKGGRKSAENRKKVNENSESDQAGLETGSTIPEARSQKPEVEELNDSSLPKDTLSTIFAFSGEVVRLNQRDFDRWALAFPDLDLRALLTGRDAWLHGQPREVQRKWFQSTATWLSNRQQEARRVNRREVEAGCEFTGPC